eukprot:6483961-Amphidinium_carterae.1
MGGCGVLCCDANHHWVMAQVVARRPEFEGNIIELGIDHRTLKAMRTLAGKKDHGSRAALNAACGGLWMNNRRARVYQEDASCQFCQAAEGFVAHTLFDCRVFAAQRKEAKVQPRREDIPACVQLGLWSGSSVPQQAPYH